MAPPRLTRRGVIAGAAAATLAPRVALAAEPAHAEPAMLRVEWRTRPCGIDALRPRFQWAIAAAAPDLRAASKPPRDLALASQTPFWWALRVWDGEGRPSGWSAPERFVTGIIGPWRAGWIAAEKGLAGQRGRIAQARRGSGIQADAAVPP